ncbi:lung adenoma susceptibility protein 2 [Brachionichthys hirsutus]|uniref:lung adenoma susceptibility protein 2 n=1 Tax=Brachionichthys hirsutus TaxID=412623 RepID=UPI003604470B
MEFRGLSGDLSSPESTVSGLLSSSGHLRSDLFTREHDPTFRYRNQSYGSASAALDAYISDFQDAPRARKPFTESSVLLQSPPSSPSRPRVSRIRNKDVLREHLTDEELDFLQLPVSSLLHGSNHGRVSMTTDELLSIPCDGSMPVTHTSAFIKGRSSHPGSSSASVNPVWDRLGSSHATPRMSHQHPQSARTYGRPRCRRRPRMGLLKPEDGLSSDNCYRSADQTAGASSLLHLPHWFTSNKPDMDCSGLSSVPDLTYPAWIQCCALSEAPPATDHAPRCRAPSWVAQLEDDDPDQTSRPRSLGDLRLQFAEHISLPAAEKRSSNLMETIVRDSRIESLIQKADQVLNSLSLRSGGAGGAVDPDGPKTQPEAQGFFLLRQAPGTPPDCIKEGVAHPDPEERFSSSSSHCHPVNLESAPAAGGATEALTNRGAPNHRHGCRLHGDAVWKQPGPVEALKQMLFRLQAVEAELQRQQHTAPGPTPATRPETEETPVTASPEPEAELRTLPGGPPPQRTLHHISHLKVLLDEPGEKQEVEEEDKDEDEGRYSSSSADGLALSKIS